jgi:hypothetical protein
MDSPMNGLGKASHIFDYIWSSISQLYNQERALLNKKNWIVFRLKDLPEGSYGSDGIGGCGISWGSSQLHRLPQRLIFSS